VGNIADLQVVSVGRRGVITVISSGLNIVLGGSVNLRFQAAFFELRLQSLRVPRRDPERNMIGLRVARRCEAVISEMRIVGVAASNNDVPDFAVTSPSFCTTVSEGVSITTSSGKDANGGARVAGGSLRATICGASAEGAE
jgi:hypothetical protein